MNRPKVPQIECGGESDVSTNNLLRIKIYLMLLRYSRTILEMVSSASFA